MKKLRVAVIFGGKSGEHEVSIASAASIFKHLDPGRYEAVPDQDRERRPVDADRRRAESDLRRRRAPGTMTVVQHRSPERLLQPIDPTHAR